MMERIDFENKDIVKAMSEAQEHRIDNLANHDEAITNQIEHGRILNGLKLPWSATHHDVAMPLGTCSVLAGINSHKKSTISVQIMLWITQHHDYKVGLASFEMTIADIGELMTQMAAGATDTTVEHWQKFKEYAKGKIYVFDQIGSVAPEKVLGAVHRFGELGCKFVCVDSLMMCSLGGKDSLERERAFITALNGLARTHDMHVMIVHHVRKPESGGDSYIPNKFDCRGSGQITDLVSLLMISWHNKKKAKLVQLRDRLGGTLTDKEKDYIEKTPCQKLIVEKNRYSPYEGHINLWQHPSRQHTKDSSQRSMHFDYNK